MTSPVLRQCAGLAACLAPLFAVAQTTAPANTLDTIVVTARAPQDARDVLGDVTVIDRQTLDAAGQSSLAEVLSRAPGIEYSNNGGPQTSSSLFIRGANSNQTLVLVDGIRVNSPVTGLAFLETFPPDAIERVEVLRGSASSLYGADAIGGVVNIITRRGNEDRPLSAYGSVGYGTYGTARTRLGLWGAAQGFDYSLSAGYGQSRGFNATSPKNFSHNPDRDGYYQNDFSGSLGYRWAPGHHVGVTAYSARINGQYDAGPDFLTGAYYNDRAITRQQVYTITSTDDITDRWQSVARLGYGRDDQRNLSSFPSRFGSEQHTYTWQNNFKLTQQQQLSLVLERLEERVTGSTSYSPNDRDTNSVGLIYRGEFGPHHVQLNARNDHSSVYDDETTGGVAYGFDLTPRVRVGVAGNTGFKTPTFQDLYFPFYGNPDLKPERSRNVEASIRYTGDATRLSAVVYRNKVKDLIASGPPDYLPYNVNRATLEGVTLSAEHDIGATTLRGSADFSNPEDDKTGNQLARRAKQVFRFGADHRFGAFKVGTEVLVSGKRYDDAANTTRLGGYTLLNLLASYDITNRLQAQVRWNNVLDRDYTLANGYYTPGSNVFFNLNWKM